MIINSLTVNAKLQCCSASSPFPPVVCLKEFLCFIVYDSCAQYMHTDIHLIHSMCALNIWPPYVTFPV